MAADKEPADPLSLFGDDNQPEDNDKHRDTGADGGKPRDGNDGGSSRNGCSRSRDRRSCSASHARNGKQRQASSGSRSRSSGDGGDESLDARVRRLRKRITDFIEKNQLDNRVSGIMQNMHPRDVVKVMEVPFPDECRNPSGFVVSQIRKAERDAGRPKDYRWDGKDWNETAKDRAGPGGRAANGGRTDRNRKSKDRDRDRGKSRNRRHSRSRGRRRDRRRRGTGRRGRRTTRRRRKRRRTPSKSSGSESYSQSGSADSYSDASAGSSEDSRSRSKRRRRK